MDCKHLGQASGQRPLPKTRKETFRKGPHRRQVKKGVAYAFKNHKLRPGRLEKGLPEGEDPF